MKKLVFIYFVLFLLGCSSDKIISVKKLGKYVSHNVKKNGALSADALTITFEKGIYYVESSMGVQFSFLKDEEYFYVILSDGAKKVLNKKELEYLKEKLK